MEDVKEAAAGTPLHGFPELFNPESIISIISSSMKTQNIHIHLVSQIRMA